MPCSMQKVCCVTSIDRRKRLGSTPGVLGLDLGARFDSTASSCEGTRPMNDPRKYPSEVKECWSIHQVFRSLGFSSDDIYLEIARDGRIAQDNTSLFVVLKEGSREFSVSLASYRTEDEAENVAATWCAFVDQANAQEFDQEVLNKIFLSSRIMRDRVKLLLALQKKGFTPCRGIN